jgi:Ca-activated chloride channel homolog
MTVSAWARVAGLGMLSLGWAHLCGGVCLAGEIGNDANIVTGLDISDSITPDEIRLEIEGMARAIRSPEVLAAIQSGKNGRIGFAVFAWSHNQFPDVV